MGYFSGTWRKGSFVNKGIQAKREELVAVAVSVGLQPKVAALGFDDLSHARFS
jgi:hypothetical protein